MNDDLEAGKLDSIHLSSWPELNPELLDEDAEKIGELLLEIATGVRRFKSDNSLPLSTEIQLLEISVEDPQVASNLQLADQDLISITRAQEIRFCTQLDEMLLQVGGNDKLQFGIKLGAQE